MQSQPDPAKTPRSPSLKDWLGLSLLGIIWGASFMAVTVAGRGFGPLSIAAGRIALGAVILLILIRMMRLDLPGLSRPNARIWLSALGLGFFSMALPFFLLSWGQVYVASGFAGVSMAAGPLLTMVLAHFLVENERISPAKAFGIGLGFVGVVLLIGPDALKSSGAGLETWARLACVGAALSYAIGSIVTRRAPQVDPIAFATMATLLGALMIVPIAAIAEGVPQSPGLTATIALIFLGVVPTAIANLLLVSVIRSAGPSFISLVNYQVPVWSVLFGWLILGEALPGLVFVALALILTGVAISQGLSRLAR